MAIAIDKDAEKSSKDTLKAELTSSQTVGVLYGQTVLTRDYSTVGTYSELRAVRRDPTVSLARGLLISCIRAGSWNIEADEDVGDDKREFMKHVLALRDSFLCNAVGYGLVDYGWMPFEKVFAEKDGRIIIESLKPLLHDITSILVTEHGRFNGYRQRPMAASIGIDLSPDKCFHSAFSIEAGNLYGRPLLADIQEACDMWNEANDGARRYDKKIAGSMLVVKYPPGTSTVNGETITNAALAVMVLDALESSGSVSIPTTIAQTIQEITDDKVLELKSWHVELLSDTSPRQESFSKRLTYLDTLKVRGLLMPERSILEGQYGTKAEAGEHGNFAITNMEAIDRQIASSINNQLVNPILALNYGEQYKGKVRVVAAPLIDKQISFLQKVYSELSKTDADIDLQGLRDKLNIPTKIGDNTGEQDG